MIGKETTHRMGADRKGFAMRGDTADLQLGLVHELNSYADQVPELQAPRQPAELCFLASSPDAGQIVVFLGAAWHQLATAVRAAGSVY